MRPCLLLTILLLPVLSGTILAQDQSIDQDNIVWDSPGENAGGSMPCGGGDIGLNVWVENGDLLFYVARSGTFDENNSLLKLGRVRIRLSPNPFLQGNFRQELRLRDGSISINGGDLQASIWVDVMRPVVHVEISSGHPLQATAVYESWRTADRTLTGRATFGTSYKWMPQKAPGGRVITYRDSIAYRDDEVLFYHHNKAPTVFDVAVRQQGLDSIKEQLFDPLKDLSFGGMLRGSDMRPDGIVHGRYLDTDFTGWQLVSKKASRRHQVELYLATTRDSANSAWSSALEKVVSEAQAHQKTARAVSSSWWKAYWEKSFIYTSSGWQAGRNYQLFRYMLGCNAYGQYPTPFNGGLFTFDPCLVDSSNHFTPDFRNWGGGTLTAQNQRLVYWPLLRSGDFESMVPAFEFYLRLLRTAELRTAVYWGHQGASFTEQLENFGLPNPTEYGWNRPDRSDKGVEYNDWLEYEWDTALEFCLMILETERFAGKDIHRYIPLVESCLRFFDEHYQYLARLHGKKSLDGNGHLILYPGSAAETYKMTYNSSSTIAGLHTVLTSLLSLPATYLNDTSRRNWTAMLRRLPPLPFRQMDGHTSIAPAQAWARVNNTESPQLYPVFPWSIYGIGRPGLDTALNTYKYDTDVVKFSSYKGWKQDNIFAARLGLTSDATTLTEKKLQDGPHRFPAFWGPGFDWTPDHNLGGSAMIGLQEMLLQDSGEKIYLFPAWPREKDVHFKLYAPYNTTVEATLKDGKVTQLKVIPEQRAKDVIDLLPSEGQHAQGVQSKHAVLKSTDLGAVHWTKGFWADRFAIVRDSMIPGLWKTYTDPHISHAFTNFEIAAGLDTGSHVGPPFHDGDFYKLLEGMAAVYAMTKDRRLDSLMDKAIAVIARSQREDGYIHTPVIIEERRNLGKAMAFEDRLNFETYNMGHLMTAACVHFRATGKKTLLNVAIRAAEYLEKFYQRSSPQLARNAVCPSHYMGIVELYRTTGNSKYLRLAENLIDIRGQVSNGTDDNQDRIPFRQQTTAMGHAVRANYLYAGVADLYTETGEDSLWYCLDRIWNDVVQHKLYITGGCGALYDGVSPDATSYNPGQIQEVHQAYGRAYQLPNTTAHNETCANIGNMLWNWRMLLASGKAYYADALEQSLYNSVLSGGSLDGTRFFYTNPLRASHAFPYDLRWSGGREPYISLSNCCPPNLGRTLAEVANYMYCVSDSGLWLNLYGGNRLSTHLPDGSALRLTQETEYPWDGQVVLTLEQVTFKEFSLFLRIPGWCRNATLQINGQPAGTLLNTGEYVEVRRVWKSGDIITLNLPMPAVLVEANPLVEETHGQAAVRRGPVVYCLESSDFPSDVNILRIAMPVEADLKPIPMHIGNNTFIGLATTGKHLPPVTEPGLYQEIPKVPAKDIPITLIPYYAWANRGPSDMTVWMDVIR